MAINFPDSPTTGQVFTSGSTSWIYDGVKWGLNTNVAVSNDSMPVGSILWYANTSTAPSGWIAADGSAVSRTTYATLFSVIGTTYGTGDGSTTFNVPSVAATTGKYYIRYTTSLGTVTTTSLATSPVGTMLDWPTTSSYPTGFLRADGSAVSRTSYADLFSLIGTTYGSGDGSTTFNLPNLVAAGSGSPVKIIKASLGGTVEPSTVSHAASHTEGGSDVITVTGNQIANYQTYRNIIINGGFDVWQRGTSFTAASLTSPYYTVDRWITVRGGLASGATWSRQTSDLTGFNYFMRCQRDSGNTGTANIHASTSFETVNIKRLQGKQLTLSFWAKAGANYSATSNTLKVQIAVGTGTDSNYLMTGFTSSSLILDSSITLTTSWQRFTLTTSSALLTTQNQLAVNIFSSPIGTAGAADYYDITGVQLEAGTTATPFEFEPYETTLRKCQRYYFKTYPQNVFFGNRNADAAREEGEFYITTNTAATPVGATRVHFPSEMRATPTVDFASWDTTTLNVANGGNFTAHRPGVGNATASMIRKSTTGVIVNCITVANAYMFFALQANAEI